MKDQGLGGSIVFIASKNALAASPGAAAYCTAKAAEVHLARCIALEGAPFGIRANTVNPDAVLRGSKIWRGEWRTQRAASNKVSEDDLEEVYRQRSLLKRSVYPEDIAEAVYYFASDLSAKSTGNILNVDAGNAVRFHALRGEGKGAGPGDWPLRLLALRLRRSRRVCGEKGLDGRHVVSHS